MRLLLLLAFVVTTATPAAQSRDAARIFVFHTSDFWLNLHQFLYVLGRDTARMPDRSRRAVAGAPKDAAQRLEALSQDERKQWAEAVAFYASGPSKQDAVFDAALVRVGAALARTGESSSLEKAAVDAPLRATLESAAPLYRQAWWAEHRRANEAWARRLGELAAKHGPTILAFLTRAYELPWPRDGQSIHVSGYANWAGAFSITGGIVVMSSLDSQLRDLAGLETAFHESMHQWDDVIDEAIAEEAKKQQRRNPALLSHAMIFYTAGEAARTAAPDYVPYAEANGMWRQRGLGAFKPALDVVWKPYLEGKGTRDNAIAALVEHATR